MSLIGSVTSLSAIHREAPRSTAAFADACQRVERDGKRASGFWECEVSTVALALLRYYLTECKPRWPLTGRVDATLTHNALYGRGTRDHL